MTLSHELMHAHVRELLGAIFTGPDPLALDDRFEGFYQRYVEFAKNGFNPRDHKLSDSLRFAILNYCVWRKHLDQLTVSTNPPKTQIGVPQADELYGLMKAYFRDINEVVVHALDFHYFYSSNSELYLRYLWLSWSTVPSILPNLEHYILRTLASVSSKFHTPLGDRFNSTFSEFKEAIADLRKRVPTNILLKDVDAFLGDETKIKSLKKKFLYAGYLASIVAKYLRSSSMHAVLSGADPNAATTDAGIVYALSPGEFSSNRVESLVLFLVDRLRRRLAEPEVENSDELFRSAWVLCAASSSGQE